MHFIVHISLVLFWSTLGILYYSTIFNNIEPGVLLTGPYAGCPFAVGYFLSAAYIDQKFNLEV